jgi:rod shape-determining protein MreD
MRRRIVNFAFLLIVFTMQICIFPFIPFLSAAPNLVLILVFSYGFIYGSREGMFYGFIAGLLMDLFYTGSFGSFTLVLTWVGFLNGRLSQLYYENYITLPLALCTVNELFYNLYIYVIRFFIRAKVNFGFYFINIILPEIMISLLFTLLIYRFFLWYNRKLEVLDERHAITGKNT